MTLSRNTKESLGIFWEGDEEDGLYAYAAWRSRNVPRPEVRSEFRRWVDCRWSELFGDDWTVWMLNARIVTWPSEREWEGFVRGLLQDIVGRDGAISWCAVEGAFSDPPKLFDPEVMMESIWVAYIAARAVFFGPPALRSPFAYIDAGALRDLWHAWNSLSD